MVLEGRMAGSKEAGTSPPSRWRWGRLSVSGSAAQQSPRPHPPHDALSGGTLGHSGNAHPAPHTQGRGSVEIPPEGIRTVNCHCRQQQRDNTVPLSSHAPTSPLDWEGRWGPVLIKKSFPEGSDRPGSVTQLEFGNNKWL